jgi:hypothetical protein
VGRGLGDGISVGCGGQECGGSERKGGGGAEGVGSMREEIVQEEWGGQERLHEEPDKN